MKILLRSLVLRACSESWFCTIQAFSLFFQFMIKYLVSHLKRYVLYLLLYLLLYLHTTQSLHIARTQYLICVCTARTHCSVLPTYVIATFTIHLFLHNYVLLFLFSSFFRLSSHFSISTSYSSSLLSSPFLSPLFFSPLLFSPLFSSPLLSSPFLSSPFLTSPHHLSPPLTHRSPLRKS